jgi:hypothetical protein
MNNSFTLCKVCIHYNPIKKTCVKSVAGATRGNLVHNPIWTVRLDEKQCGVEAKWFKEIPPQDEFFDM